MSRDFKTPITIDGHKVWYEENDGHESGLDADLLDGHEWEEIEQSLNGKQPLHGFTYPYDVSLSYSEVTRTITLTPAVSSFSFWINGTKIVKNSIVISVPHSNVSGQYFFTFDGSGQLSVSTSPWDLTDLTKTPVCVVYYNQSNGKGFANFELHRANRNIYAHKQSHFSIGTFIKHPASNFALSGYTIQSGTNADVTFSVSSGTILDEDIEWAIDTLADGGPYTVLYRTGDTEWVWQTGLPVPYVYNSGTNKMQVNSASGGVYSLVDIPNGDYINYYLFATTALDDNKKLFLVPGQTVYGSRSLADEESFLDLNFVTTVPLEEFAPLWKITLRHRTTYSSTGRGAIEAVTKLQGTRASISMSGAGSAHNALTGRSDPDCHPASAITNTPSGLITSLTVQDALNEIDTLKAPLIPLTDNTTDLGTNLLAFRNIYAHELFLSESSLYLGTTKIIGTEGGTVEIKTDAGQNLLIRTDQGLLDIKTIGANANINLTANGTSSAIQITSSSSTVTINGIGVSVYGDTTFYDDLTVNGNLFVLGTQTVIETTSMAISDNITVLNSGETGSGVSLTLSGVQIDRGELTDWQIVFDETDDLLKVGPVGALEIVATRNWSTGNLAQLSHNHDDRYYTETEIDLMFLSSAIPGTIYDLGNALDDIVTDGFLRITHLSGVKNYSAGLINYDTDVTNKPSTFPPSVHVHLISEVTGLQTSLDGKASSSHTHTLSNITSTNTGRIPYSNGTNLVESSSFVFDANGTLILNASSVSNTNNNIVSVVDSTKNTAFGAMAYGATAAINCSTIGGTKAAPTGSSNNYLMLNLVGSTTHDGTTFSNVVSMIFGLEADPTSTSYPTFIAFNTSPVGEKVRYERLRITGAGRVLIGTTTDDAVHLLQVNGDVGFIGTGRRIRGDFSNSTIANRTLFQNRTTNSISVIGVIPNGTGTESYFVCESDSNATNSNVVSFGVEHDVKAAINVFQRGTATQLPLLFTLAGVEKMRISTTGNLLIGTSTDNTTDKLQVAGSICSTTSKLKYGNTLYVSGLVIDSTKWYRVLSLDTTYGPWVELLIQIPLGHSVYRVKLAKGTGGNGLGWTAEVDCGGIYNYAYGNIIQVRVVDMGANGATYVDVKFNGNSTRDIRLAITNELANTNNAYATLIACTDQGTTETGVVSHLGFYDSATSIGVSKSYLSPWGRIAIQNSSTLVASRYQLGTQDFGVGVDSTSGFISTRNNTPLIFYTNILKRLELSSANATALTLYGNASSNDITLTFATVGVPTSYTHKIKFSYNSLRQYVSDTLIPNQINRGLNIGYDDGGTISNSLVVGNGQVAINGPDISSGYQFQVNGSAFVSNGLQVVRNWDGYYGNIHLRGNAPAITFWDTDHSRKWMIHNNSDVLYFFRSPTQAEGANDWTAQIYMSSGGLLTVGNLAGTGNRAVYSDANGTLTNTASDERLKKDVEPLTYGLNEVLNLNPVFYKWKDEEKMGNQTEIGLIAQQVSKICPEVIGTNSDGMLSLDYSKLIAVLINAIKELKGEINELSRIRSDGNEV